jgi:hypothetical protein
VVAAFAGQKLLFPVRIGTGKKTLQALPRKRWTALITAPTPDASPGGLRGQPAADGGQRRRPGRPAREGIALLPGVAICGSTPSPRCPLRLPLVNGMTLCHSETQHGTPRQGRRRSRPGGSLVIRTAVPLIPGHAA